VNFYPLVQKLIEIERAVGVLESSEIRAMVIEAEETVLQIQKEAVEILGVERGNLFRPSATVEG
jgi:hypothetical protein